MTKAELFVEIYRRGGGADFAMAETDKVWEWLTAPLQNEADPWVVGYKRNKAALEKAYQALVQTRSAL